VDGCEACGFVYADLDTADIPDAIRALPAQYASRLADRVEALRAHPASQERTWSALEYACHVRDVLLVQHERVATALIEDRPGFEPMRREERVAELRYNQQDPAAIARALDTAAGALAALFAELSDDQWDRLVVYNWPTEMERTLAWVGRHTVHEGIHHLRDVDHVLDAAGAA
jgi:hypothetical protein